MRTSNQLPDECREEIRGRMKPLSRLEDMYYEGALRSTPPDFEFAKNGYAKAMLIEALEWVLGDDGK